VTAGATIAPGWLAVTAIATGAIAGCGEAGVGSSAHKAKPGPGVALASATKPPASQNSGGGGAQGSGVGSARGVAKEVADPEASKSFPAAPSVHHKAAAAPATAAEAVVAPGAASDAEIQRELAQEHTVERAERQRARQLQTPSGGGGSIGGNGTIAPPPGIPAVVARVIAGANAIADFPYVFGGGHGSFVDNAYDCSGSVSYALAAGGLLSAPLTSGELESWGAAGPGRWITVFANAGHTYMYVNLGNGWIRYDTSGRSGVFGSRWQAAIRSNEGFVARHWPGL
jgi:cell wall-associated NlpC family hydrolase